jgi:hypothetical protein
MLSHHYPVHRSVSIQIILNSQLLIASFHFCDPILQACNFIKITHQRVFYFFSQVCGVVSRPPSHRCLHCFFFLGPNKRQRDPLSANLILQQLTSLVEQCLLKSVVCFECVCHKLQLLNVFDALNL